MRFKSFKKEGREEGRKEGRKAYLVLNSTLRKKEKKDFFPATKKIIMKVYFKFGTTAEELRDVRALQCLKTSK